MSKKVHMSMRGVPVDMEALMAKNEGAIALGNAKMNARGDIIGEGGQVITRREDLARTHQMKKQNNANVSLKPAIPDKFETPAEALARLAKAANDANASNNAAIVPDNFDFSPEEMKELESFEETNNFDDAETDNKGKKKRTIVEKD